MSKSFALCSEGGNLPKPTTERSGGCEGGNKKNIQGKNGGDSRRNILFLLAIIGYLTLVVQIIRILKSHI